jgi:hypothetical protein
MAATNWNGELVNKFTGLSGLQKYHPGGRQIMLL